MVGPAMPTREGKVAVRVGWGRGGGETENWEVVEGGGSGSDGERLMTEPALLGPWLI